MAEKRACEESRRWSIQWRCWQPKSAERVSELRQRVAQAQSLAEAAERECGQRAQKCKQIMRRAYNAGKPRHLCHKSKGCRQLATRDSGYVEVEEATAAQSAYAMELMLQYPSEGLIEPDRRTSSDYSNVKGEVNTFHLKLAERRRLQLDASAPQRAKQREHGKQADGDREALRVGNANNAVRRRSSARAVTAEIVKRNILEETATKAMRMQAVRRVSGVKIMVNRSPVGDR